MLNILLKSKFLLERARKFAPVIIFLDEFDAVASRRLSYGVNGAMEKQILAQFFTCMDEMTLKIIVLAKINLPEALDSALRFDLI